MRSCHRDSLQGKGRRWHGWDQTGCWLAYRCPGEGQWVTLVWRQATRAGEGKLRQNMCGGQASASARSPRWCGQWEDPVRSFAICCCTEGTNMALAVPGCKGRPLSGCLLQAPRATQPFISQHLGFFTAHCDSARTSEHPCSSLSAVH